MGGEVGCDSEPGHGSTFWFEAPFGVLGTAAPLPLHEPTPGPVSGETPGPWATLGAGAEEACRALAARREWRLLLVEDNELNREVALQLLAAVGFEADAAEDGREAIALAAGNAYDLVLMDVQMPGMNGLEVAPIIRMLPGHEKTPLIALTANAFDDDREASLRAGMNDHLAKPVEPDRLYRTLLRWLGRDLDGRLLPTVATLIGTPGPRSLSPTPGPRAAAFTPGPGRVAPPSPVLQLLADVEGLDVGRGLRSLLGQEDTWIELLQQFEQRHTGDGEELCNLLAAGDTAGARLVAHSLRGVAGTLGLWRIQAQATDLEFALLRGDAPATLLTSADDLHRLLRVTGEALARAWATGADAVPPALPDDERAELLARLEALLRDDDMAAVELHRRIGVDLQRLAAGPANRLARQVEAFAFGDALATIGELRRALAGREGMEP
jgi:CheY-like chemotaxis protein